MGNKAFYDLSHILEKQLETVLANQRLILAMHTTLISLLPKYETEVLDALAIQPTAKNTQQDEMNQLWIAQAKLAIRALRE